MFKNSKKNKDNIPSSDYLYKFKLNQKIYLQLKKILDFLISAVFIILLLPLLILTCLIIKITSKGPAVFTQERIGKLGKIIKVYKFRTMFLSAPKNVATCELENPSKHITKFGKILRMTSFDEVLQLFNVLKGEMSLIGPRPIIISESEIHKLRNKSKVYSICPGITGLAQIKGRDLLNPAEKVNFDEIYMKNISLKMDLYILIKSIIVVFKRANFFEGKRQEIT